MNGLTNFWNGIQHFVRRHKQKNTDTNCTDRLTAEHWGDLYNESQVESLLKSIVSENYAGWTAEMLHLTSSREKTLEIGSGTGQTSLVLALNGRKSTALDFEQRCLNLTQLAAKRLNIEIKTVFADAEKELPFENQEFDWVFQAGLLEHFDQEQRIALLRNWKRVGKRMVSIIPNAASLAYRVGKAMQEQSGTWQYGKEMPQYSLEQDFRAAGLTVEREYSIDEKHALNFLPKKHYLRSALERWINENPCDDNCGQGYLLVTVGTQSPSA